MTLSMPYYHLGLNGFVDNAGPNPSFSPALDCGWTPHLRLVLVPMALVDALVHHHEVNGSRKDCSIHPDLS